jgi:hypothetical protein
MSGDLKAKPLPRFQRNFHGAVGLANWLRLHNYYTSVHPVNLAEGSVWPGFKNAVQKYRGGKEIVRFYVPDLVDTSIHVEFDDRYEILVPQIFNFCHKRFALCKELCHILTDEGTAKLHNPFEQLNRALRTHKKVLDYKESDLEINPFFSSTDLPSEDFCFLLALEMLIPVFARDKLILEHRVDGISTYDIAGQLRIPESLVIFFIQSGYNVAFKRLGGIEYKLPGC